MGMRLGRTVGWCAPWGQTPGGAPVVTTLFVDGDEALEEIARFVGHAGRPPLRAT